MLERFENEIAVITSAGAGIGAATARILAREGATVVIGDIDTDAATRVAESIVAEGGSAEGVHFDAMDEQSVRSFVKDAHARHGRIDILHNNAGGTWVDKDTQVTDITDDVWTRILNWNLGRTHWATQEALRFMVEQGGGSIVNTVTVGSSFANSTGTVYGTVKAAVTSYTRYVAVQYGPRGIRCNGVSPGLIYTPGIDEMSDDFRTEIIKNLTTPRMGKPDDIGHAVAFLASEEAGYINGQVLNVDGGVSVRFPHDATVLDMGGYGPGHPKNPLPSTDVS